MQKPIPTSNRQTSLFGEVELTSLQEDSHANLIAQQENGLEKKTNVTYGQRCLERYEKLNPSTSWAKTLAAYLLGTTDWYSRRCALTWKMKGTKSKRLLFQLVPKTHPTEGIGFGLLPTPDASIRGARQNQGNHQITLQDVVASNTEAAKALALKCGLLPTPTAQDFKRRGPNSKQQGISNIENYIISAKDGKTSQLNPRFVAEMMGFPPNWTELPFLNGETNLSKDMETP